MSRIRLAAQDLGLRLDAAWWRYVDIAPHDADVGLALYNRAGCALCSARANARSRCYLAALRALWRGWRLVRALEGMAGR